MRELLIRYLLGELDAVEHRQVTARLEESPDLRRELAYLRECFQRSEEGAGQTAEPPPGLASRTVGKVSDYQRPCSEQSAASGAACAATPYWSFLDLAIAGGALLAVSMLFLPALRQSRDASRRMVCANNLGQIGFMLAHYSAENGSQFPVVGEHDNAGMYTVILVEAGIVTADELGRLVICPSSSLADEVAEGTVVIRIPNMQELKAAPRHRLVEFRRVMGGSFAYRIGFFENKVYRYPPDMRCPKTPLMADQPSFQRANMTSANHGGCGQNVLYQDGSVRYEKTCKLSIGDDKSTREDHLYLNSDGQPAAGCDSLDIVLGRSDATPADGVAEFVIE